MMMEFPPFEHLYHFANSQAADQWLLAEDVDVFAIFASTVALLEIPTEEVQWVPNSL